MSDDNTVMQYNIFETVVIKEHLDFMGHVNNAVYLSFFEEARWHYYSQFGFTKEHIHKNKKGPIILKTYIQYKKEILLYEKILIKSNCVSYNSLLEKMRQTILKVNGQVACSAEFVFSFFDLVNRKLVMPSGLWLEMHKKLGVLKK